MRKRIAVCFKDAGSYFAVMPVIELLMSKHPDWQWQFFASSVAAAKLAGQCLTSAEFDPSQFDLLISGTSSALDGDTIEIDIQRKAEGSIPIILVSDIWLSACRGEHEGLRPTVITSVDNQCTQLIRQLKPNSKVVTTGSPAFDTLSLFDFELMRHDMRRSLGILSNQKTVCFFGGYDDQTIEALALVIKALDEIRDEDLALIVRQHPKVLHEPAMESNRQAFQAVLKTYGRAFGEERIFSADHVVCGELLLPAADVVTGTYSTLQLQSVYLLSKHGNPQTLHVLLPKDCFELCQNHFRGYVTTVPSVSLGASLAVYDDDDDSDVTGFLVNLLFNETIKTELVSAAKKHFCLDGGATARVATEVEKLLE